MENITNYIVKELFCGIKATVNFADGTNVALSSARANCRCKGTWSAKADGVSLKIKAVAKDNNVVFYADLVSDKPLSSTPIEWGVSTATATNVVGLAHDNPWWMQCGWLNPGDGFKKRTEHGLLKVGEEDIAFSGLMGDVFGCEMEDDKIYLWTGFAGSKELHGPFITVAAASTPMDAMANAWRYAKEVGAINVPLKEERPYPEIFEHFGWCTWDAFYHDVTAEKIFAKLDEFKSKGIQLKWMIIDDGWNDVIDGKMVAFSADKGKFPDGLKACIDKIKNEYGVGYVGVWHTISGYWGGVKVDSDLAKDYENALFSFGQGHLSPDPDPEKGFKFWDAFHGYLADCGVDFVKVDNQSSTHDYVSCNMTVADAARGIHEALERSVNKHFGGKIINCMGMSAENVLARPTSAMNRNSNDFFPKQDNFPPHILQNLFNTMWHSCIMHCDFDMWWSEAGLSNPKQSGVLRAISGGPVYVSDAVGETNADNIIPVVGKDGDICRLDNAAKPTLDCIYSDSRTNGKLLKAYNNSADNIALAVFNISKQEISDSFALDVIPVIDADKEYIAYEYFTKKFTRVNKDTVINAKLDVAGVLSYSLYPIASDENGEYIILGDCDRYVGIASKEKKTVLVKDVIG